MKRYKIFVKSILASCILLSMTSCEKYLEEQAENVALAIQTDYTKTENMIQPLVGTYARFQQTEWENLPIIAVRGDDVNAGGLGDQQDFAATDNYSYNKDFWMYNSYWLNYFGNVLTANSAIEQIQKYQQYAPNKAIADQYIAEVKVLKAFWLFQLSRTWGSLVVPTTADPTILIKTPLSTKDEVMQLISGLMDEAIPNLPSIRPNERADLPGGVTKYTALALKALANLELKNYQGVADATGEIINSGKFSLESDFYQLFKIPGKLSNENLLEMQYSDLAQATGDNYAYLFAFFGPQGWTPAVAGAGDGWGFWEPSIKFIKFMIDRGETVRLQTSVLFTNRGIAEIQTDPQYANLPSWISNTTPSGDVTNDYARALFASGKHYLPSNQLTTGRTEYGTNKNLPVIRYAEILLMYAEALTQGATGNAGTAVEAVNIVRERANIDPLSSVTLDQVMDEKFAELAMEWGQRFYDMVRLGKYNELSYEGRVFNESKIFLPYPQPQVDQLPILGGQ